ncbi:MAG: hypothetical protein JNJ58_11435 [Chitinophagaceae bacterium]|nr:hypothetical protein [Chitinophagaceae bacterium]
MLDQLFKLIQTESQEEIIENPAIPNEMNNHAVGLATDSVFGGLQSALSNGGLKDVLGMFTGNSESGANNPIASGISGNLIDSLMKKFGIDSPVATQMAGSLIPKVLSRLVQKTNDPNDSSFDINGVIGSLIGGAPQGGSGVQIPGLTPQPNGGGIDFGGILKNLSHGGLDTNHDGGMGLDDLTGLIGQAAGSAGQHNGQPQGGVMDMLKELMGN